MNLIIGLLIIVCLAGSEFVNSQPVDDIGSRIFAVLITIALVPGLAAFQTAIVLKKIRREPISFQSKQSLFRRLTFSHGLAWLAASLAIIWALRWQDVVRGAWGLDQWPLVDECLILFPMIISLVASWFVFYELQSALVDTNRHAKGSSENANWLAALKPAFLDRLAFVSIRFRLYFMLILIPVGIFVLIRDVANLSTALAPTVSASLSIAGLLVLVVFFPFLLLLIWKTSPLENDEQRQELLGICDKNKLGVATIREWRTDNQIVNALVVGFVPKLRMIMFSDGMLNQFTRRELEAVLRHEAGHIRLWHLPTRMVFLMMPLIGIAIIQPEFLELDNTKSVSGESLVYASSLVVAIGLYMYFAMRWLSHKIEFEADMFAIQAETKENEPYKSNSESALDAKSRPNIPTICQNRAAAMKDALLRLAAISPNDYEHNSVFHPSIRRRINFINSVLKSPKSGEIFSASFARRRRILAALIIAITITAAFIS